MIRGLSIGLLLAASAFSSKANLNETLAQCVSRYGQPVSGESENAISPPGRHIRNAVFRTTHYLIVVMFEHQRADMESFSKTDKSEFSKDEITQLLRQESAGAKWTADSPNY